MALYLVLLAVYFSAAVGQSATPVYFSLIVSYGEFGFNSSGGIPAVDIALDYISYWPSTSYNTRQREIQRYVSAWGV